MAMKLELKSKKITNPSLPKATTTAQVKFDQKQSKSGLAGRGSFGVAGVNDLTAVFQHQFNLPMFLQLCESLSGQSNSHLHSLRHYRGGDQSVIRHLNP